MGASTRDMDEMKEKADEANTPPPFLCAALIIMHPLTSYNGRSTTRAHTRPHEHGQGLQDRTLRAAEASLNRANHLASHVVRRPLARPKLLELLARGLGRHKNVGAVFQPVSFFHTLRQTQTSQGDAATVPSTIRFRARAVIILPRRRSRHKDIFSTRDGYIDLGSSIWSVCLP